MFAAMKRFIRPRYLLVHLLVLLACLAVVVVVRLVMHFYDLHTARPSIQYRTAVITDKAQRHFAVGDSKKAVRSLLVYNRVPKTGSTSLLGIAKSLNKKLGYSTIYVKSGVRHWSLLHQAMFVRNVTSWELVMPALYHGHFSYVDFKRFGAVQTPVYINMVRDPLERLVSSFYFRSTGDDYSNKTYSSPNETFEECHQRKHVLCSLQSLWSQVQMMCGMDFYCADVGNPQALQQAKDNLLHRYLLVGITERFNEFVELLEILLPEFFRGAGRIIRGDYHLRKTKKKQQISDDVIAEMKNSDAWKMSDEFYQFAKDNFNSIYAESRSRVKNHIPYAYTSMHFKRGLRNRLYL